MDYIFPQMSDEIKFDNFLSSKSELRELFSVFCAKLEFSSEYDSIEVIFPSNNLSFLELKIPNSNLSLEFDEDDQTIILSKLNADIPDIVEDYTEYEFDEDQLDNIISYINGLGINNGW